jgi:ABC-type proline/glycine betaine transport system ATPase subunit
MSYPSKEIINKFIAAHNSFDIDSMVSLLHPEVQFKNISNEEVDVQTEGKEEFEKLARQSATLFREREQKVISCSEADNKVNVEIQYRAILAVDLPNGLRSGDRMEMQGRSEYIIKDGLIYSVIDKGY